MDMTKTWKQACAYVYISFMAKVAFQGSEENYMKNNILKYFNELKLGQKEFLHKTQPL